jgi:hypothetical protein
MKLSTSRLVICAGSFCAKQKKTFRSKAAARTEFGRARPARNVRYSSRSSCQSRTTCPPEGANERSTDRWSGIWVISFHREGSTLSMKSSRLVDHPHINEYALPGPDHEPDPDRRRHVCAPPSGTQDTRDELIPVGVTDPEPVGRSRLLKAAIPAHQAVGPRRPSRRSGTSRLFGDWNASRS